MPSVKVTVDTGLCIGAANCVGVIPEVFQLDTENMAIVLGPNASPSPHERVLEVSQADFDKLQEAAESCPTLAITVVPA